MSTTKNTLAVIWDFDGTLVDTRQKNLNVTRKIIDKVSEAGWNKFSVLETVENYNSANNKAANWREFYKQSFGFNENQIDKTVNLPSRRLRYRRNWQFHYCYRYVTRKDPARRR